MTKTRKLGLVALATSGLLLAGAGAASADTPGAPQTSILDALTRGLPLPVTNTIPGLDGVDLPIQAPGVPGTGDLAG